FCYHLSNGHCRYEPSKLRPAMAFRMARPVMSFGLLRNHLAFLSLLCQSSPLSFNPYNNVMYRKYFTYLTIPIIVEHILLALLILFMSSYYLNQPCYD
ncbi:hypothetical protein L9F63_018577, partial [Diploptera punctata]